MTDVAAGDLGPRERPSALKQIDVVPNLSDAVVAAEVGALDELWEREWDVGESRAYAPQRVKTPQLPTHSANAHVVRRVLDIAISLVAIVLFAPVMVVIACVVRATSQGPALFAQFRPGAGGVEFRMLKFRSMKTETEQSIAADQGTREQFEENDFKLGGDDPRITGVGRFIRRTSLDELPQLFNVLRGDMSIVGIRPLMPRQLEKRPVEDQLLFKMMRPGMTGLWQVEGRSEITGDERVALDRQYVMNWSVMGDLKILARTPLAVVSSAGAR